MNEELVKSATRKANEDIIRKAAPWVRFRGLAEPKTYNSAEVLDFMPDWTDEAVDQIARTCEGYPSKAFDPQHGRRRVIVLHFNRQGEIRRDIEMIEAEDAPKKPRGRRK